MQLAGLPLLAAHLTSCQPSLADDFTETPSGLRYLDLKYGPRRIDLWFAPPCAAHALSLLWHCYLLKSEHNVNPAACAGRVGEGATPRPGDRVVCHWAGFTKGYQGKRIDNTSVRDEPYEFILGDNSTIKAFQEAVATMRVGGIRRVEVPGEREELGYSKDRSKRFTDELVSQDLKIFKYRVGPQPKELGGQRSLDFVLDNPTLYDFNRTLLYDIKLLAVRPAK